MRQEGRKEPWGINCLQHNKRKYGGTGYECKMVLEPPAGYEQGRNFVEDRTEKAGAGRAENLWKTA